MTPQSARRVEAIWSFAAHERGSDIVLPDGRCDIIIRNHADTPHVIVPVITGPGTQAFKVDYDVGDQWFGIRLRPEHAAALWRHDLKQAVDNVLRGQDAKDFLPTLAALDGQSLSLETLVDVIPIQTWPAVDQRVTRAIDMLHVSGGRLQVDDLAGRVACTTRHLNRLFRQSIGLSTKTYGQLVQFHRTLRLIKGSRLPLTAAAYEGGYADHAHLTRAFRRFGGFTPSKLPSELSLPTLFQS